MKVYTLNVQMVDSESGQYIGTKRDSFKEKYDLFNYILTRYNIEWNGKTPCTLVPYVNENKIALTLSISEVELE